MRGHLREDLAKAHRFLHEVIIELYKDREVQSPKELPSISDILNCINMVFPVYVFARNSERNRRTRVRAHHRFKPENLYTDLVLLVNKHVGLDRDKIDEKSCEWYKKARVRAKSKKVEEADISSQYIIPLIWNPYSNSDMKPAFMNMRPIFFKDVLGIDDALTGGIRIQCDHRTTIKHFYFDDWIGPLPPKAEQEFVDVPSIIRKTKEVECLFDGMDPYKLHLFFKRVSNLYNQAKADRTRGENKVVGSIEKIVSYILRRSNLPELREATQHFHDY